VRYGEIGRIDLPADQTNSQHPSLTLETNRDAWRPGETMDLWEIFGHVAGSYEKAKDEPFARHPLANFIRKEAPPVIANAIRNSHFKVTGSPGKGSWKETPWFGIFDPNITVSGTKGQYVTYSFNLKFTALYLVLGQGTVAIRREFGRNAIKELQRRVALIRALLPEYQPRFSDEPIHYGARSDLTNDYEPAIAFGTTYDLAAPPPEETLVDDLRAMARLYLLFTERGGLPDP
jgi:MrcB-like, N-terminal domain